MKKYWISSQKKFMTLKKAKKYLSKEEYEKLLEIEKLSNLHNDYNEPKRSSIFESAFDDPRSGGGD